MSSFGRHDWALKLLSVLLAVVLWVYVSNELNPLKDREFKAIPVEVRGIGANLAVSELPAPVRVRIEANQKVMSELNIRAIEVFIDVKGLKAGRRTVPVQVRVPQGAKLVDLRPQEVAVTVEPWLEKQVPLKVNFSDGPPKGYKVLTVKTRPDEILLRGPKSVLEKVSASISVATKGRDKSYDESVPVRIAGNKGELLDERIVKRNPLTVDAFVAIVPDMPIKVIKVVPQMIGVPAKNYRITNTIVYPTELTISGDRFLLEGLNQVSTLPINITGLEKELDLEVAPVLPKGVIASVKLIRVVISVERQ